MALKRNAATPNQPASNKPVDKKVTETTEAENETRLPEPGAQATEPGTGNLPPAPENAPQPEGREGLETLPSFMTHSPDADPSVRAAVARIVERPETEPDLPAERRMDLALGATNEPMAQELVRAARLGLEDISPEAHLQLAIEAHWTIGKASGYIPEFASLSENMKAAYLKVVRDVWLAAQRRVRAFDE